MPATMSSTDGITSSSIAGANGIGVFRPATRPIGARYASNASTRSGMASVPTAGGGAAKT